MITVKVPSTTRPGVEYTVMGAGGFWTCNCKGHVHNSKGLEYTCVHISELAASLFTHVVASADKGRLSKRAAAKLGLATG